MDAVPVEETKTGSIWSIGTCMEELLIAEERKANARVTRVKNHGLSGFMLTEYDFKNQT